MLKAFNKNKDALEHQASELSVMKEWNSSLQRDLEESKKRLKLEESELLVIKENLEQSSNVPNENSIEIDARTHDIARPLPETVTPHVSSSLVDRFATGLREWISRLADY